MKKLVYGVCVAMCLLFGLVMLLGSKRAFASEGKSEVNQTLKVGQTYEMVVSASQDIIKPKKEGELAAHVAQRDIRVVVLYKVNEKGEVSVAKVQTFTVTEDGQNVSLSTKVVHDLTTMTIAEAKPVEPKTDPKKVDPSKQTAAALVKHTPKVCECPVCKKVF